LSQDVVSAQHLASIVEPVRFWWQQQQVILPQLQPDIQEQRIEAWQLALDRLGQAVQVALATQCVYGNKRKYIL